MYGYNMVYGKFAALPLLLLWLRFSWLIILFGAEVGYSSQKMEYYIFETDFKHFSHRRRKVYALYMTTLLVHNFLQQNPSLSIRELAEKMKVPSAYIYSIAMDLCESGVLTQIYLEDKYANDTYIQPAFDVNQIRVSTVLEAMDRLHSKNEYQSEGDEVHSYFNEVLDHIDILLEKSDADILLKDI